MIFLLRGIIVDIKLIRVECNSIIEVQAQEEKRVYISRKKLLLWQVMEFTILGAIMRIIDA